MRNLVVRKNQVVVMANVFYQLVGSLCLIATHFTVCNLDDVRLFSVS